MNKVVLTIGVLLVIWGLWIVIRPEFIRKIIQVLCKGLLVYIPPAVRVLLGIVFLLSARECRVPWVVMAFGIIMFAAGIVMFMMKAGKLRSMFEWWGKRSLTALRVMGLLAAAVGGVIAWAA